VIEPSKGATAHAGNHPQEARVGVSTIEQSFSAKRNSLNFLRLILALAVVFSHSITLGLFGSEWILGKPPLARRKRIRAPVSVRRGSRPE
jgi:hypothetical protein